MYVCTLCMYVCMYVCMYYSMYACMYKYVYCMYILYVRYRVYCTVVCICIPYYNITVRMHVNLDDWMCLMR
jgi:hypothetical protein